MFNIYDQEGNIVESLPVKINFNYLRNVASEFDKGANIESIKLSLKILGLNEQEINILMSKINKKDIYCSFMSVVYDSDIKKFLEVTP